MAPHVGTIVSWMFNAADKPGDVVWQRMNIGAELLCESTLQGTIRGCSKIFYCFESICIYAIDITEMTQTNLSTGKVRSVRRAETLASRFTLKFGLTANDKTPELACHGFRERRLTYDPNENRFWKEGIFGGNEETYGRCARDRRRDFVQKHCHPYSYR